jgi:hypothetical protein
MIISDFGILMSGFRRFDGAANWDSMWRAAMGDWKNTLRVGAIGQVCFMYLSCSHANAGVVIDINYVYVETEVSPRQELHWAPSHQHYELDVNKTIMMPHAAAALGGKIVETDRIGRHFTNQFNIVNGAFQITTLFEGAILTTTVRTNGHDTCAASLVWRKRPGQRYFLGYRISNGELMYESDAHAENVSCSIHGT